VKKKKTAHTKGNPSGAIDIVPRIDRKQDPPDTAVSPPSVPLENAYSLKQNHFKERQNSSALRKREITSDSTFAPFTDTL